MQFAQKMNDQKNPILLYAGKNHITALVKKNNQYTIMDTWDCSQEKAGDYFILEEEKKEEINYVDKIIVHPSFLEGIVYKQDNQKLYVAFQDQDRILMLEWVKQNCKIGE
ncbi:MAG: hypothetical protein ACI4UK_07605 [Floccifex sp.]